MDSEKKTIYHSNIETVKLLIDAKCDLNLKDENGWTVEKFDLKEITSILSHDKCQLPVANILGIFF